MRVAITGANGHVGCNLARMMLDKGYQLRLMRHEFDKGIRDLDAEIVEADILDKESVLRFVDGADAVIHLAARISIDGDPDGSVTRTNRDGTINVLEACLHHKVDRLVHFSTIHAYDPFPLDEVLDETRRLVGDHGSLYDKSKVAGEVAIFNAVRDEGFDAVVVTPTSVFGPLDHYPSLLGQAIMDMYTGKVPALVPGGYDFVPVGDIAQGTIAALERGRRGEKYLLSGEFLTVKDLNSIVSGIAGKSNNKPVIPSWVLKGLLPVFRLQSKMNGKPPLFTRESLTALVDSNPNISSAKAERELGYIKTPVRQALKETVDWFRESGMLS